MLCAAGEDYPCLGKVNLYTLEKGSRALGGGSHETVWSARLVVSRDMAGAVTRWVSCVSREPETSNLNSGWEQRLLLFMLALF